MIEPYVLGPGDFVVALATNLAELTLVRIIILVTGIAIRLKKDLMGRLRVAISANEIRMPAEQREIRFNLMLE